MEQSLERLHRGLNVDEKAQPLTKGELSGHSDEEGGRYAIQDKHDEPM